MNQMLTELITQCEEQDDELRKNNYGSCVSKGEKLPKSKTSITVKDKKFPKSLSRIAHAFGLI